MPYNVKVLEFMVIMLKSWMNGWLKASGWQKILILMPLLFALEVYMTVLTVTMQYIVPSIVAKAYIPTHLKVHGVVLLVTGLVWMARNSRFVQHKAVISVLYVLLFLYQVYLSYAVGVFGFAVGYVVAALLIMLLTMLSRLFTVITFVVGTVGFVLVLELMRSNMIGYAPFIQPQVNNIGDLSYAYMIAVQLFVLPYVLFFVAVCLEVANQWVIREREIRYLSTTDVMLGINNRRAITAELEAVLDRRSRFSEFDSYIAIILCDLDYFKRINDQYGHATGDVVLIAVSKCLKDTLRDDDSIGRYGGEEFLIALANADFAIAKAVAERCRKAIERLDVFDEQGIRIPVTASFGVYCTDDAAMQMDAIVSAADKCLYKAKSLGRNRVEAMSDILR